MEPKLIKSWCCVVVTLFWSLCGFSLMFAAAAGYLGAVSLGLPIVLILMSVCLFILIAVLCYLEQIDVILAVVSDVILGALIYFLGWCVQTIEYVM
ncbi:MAG: hypothetical protein LBT89_01025 [Planctomycetaceae bacterium]|jgi:hypothetical protein|nr:hypothetical protein [Planctomycetaceae bacterium]